MSKSLVSLTLTLTQRDIAWCPWRYCRIKCLPSWLQSSQVWITTCGICRGSELRDDLKVFLYPSLSLFHSNHIFYIDISRYYDSIFFRRNAEPRHGHSRDGPYRQGPCHITRQPLPIFSSHLRGLYCRKECKPMRCYNKTDKSEVYRIAMGMIFIVFTRSSYPYCVLSSPPSS